MESFSDYILWICMIIQMVVFVLLIKLVVDFLSRFNSQVGVIELIEEDKRGQKISN